MNVIKPFNLKAENPQDLVNRLFEERMKSPSPPSGQEGAQEGPSQAGITSSTGFWTIQNVEYKGVKKDYDLVKELFPAQTQEKHIAHAKKAMKKGEFFIPNSQLSHSIVRALYLQRDSDNLSVKGIKEFLNISMINKWLMTSTRIIYNPNSPDTIIHNHGLSNEFKESLDFIGPDEWVKDTQTPDVYKALLGSNNTQEIQEIYNWLCSVPPRLYRLNSRPKKIEERVVGFDAYSDLVLFSCYFGCGYSIPALSVRPHENFSTGNEVIK